MEKQSQFFHIACRWIELRTDRGAETVLQRVRSADLLCNSPAGVIKGAVTKTLKGDQEGGNGQLSRRGGH